MVNFAAPTVVAVSRARSRQLCADVRHRRRRVAQHAFVQQRLVAPREDVVRGEGRAARSSATPPTNCATTNCQPSNRYSTMPSSITRFVEATMKTSEFVHDAPRAKSARDMALAA